MSSHNPKLKQRRGTDFKQKSKKSDLLTGSEKSPPKKHKSKYDYPDYGDWVLSFLYPRLQVQNNFLNRSGTIIQLIYPP